jgi:hypothetical protein
MQKQFRQQCGESSDVSKMQLSVCDCREQKLAAIGIDSSPRLHKHMRKQLQQQFEDHAGVCMMQLALHNCREQKLPSQHIYTHCRQDATGQGLYAS